ncbi:redoxin domain-containing protein [Stappia sp. GBMRC 2046]|uniref:Redoxin domain-containing protein n=1 Tax=Stappia sediminis TaxID=2692190 RepID=A0A7X3LRI2_9HYPH|nr:SCO family protein [Stappia sediminis]MXN63772.1 redoxin domain-containing protein [Stappia sediminis]
MIRWIAAALFGVAAAFAYDQINRATEPESVTTAGLTVENPPSAATGDAIATDAGTSPQPASAKQAEPGSDDLPPGGPALPFPIDVEARFDLIDQNGKRVTEADFAGKPMALFFGYASCEAVCSAVMPDVARTMELLEDQNRKFNTVMITIDPARDTPEAMRKNLPRWNSGITGLTGSEKELSKVRDLFQVDIQVVGHDENGGAIYSHGSLVYLIGPDSKLMTILPPVYGPEHMAKIIARYI